MHTFLFVIALLAFLAAVICGAMALGDKDYRTGLIGGAVAAFLAFLLFFGLAGIRSVPVHSVGVKTSFGKIEGSLRPGLHWFNAPWSTVTVLDETIQTTTWYASSWSGNASNPGCLVVRIGGQQLACANVTLKWQLLDQAAPGLFNNYDNGGNGVMASLTSNLVTIDLQTVVNHVMGDYNPIQDTTALTASATGQTSQPSQFSKFGPEILAAMRADLKGQISVLSVNLSNAYYAGATEGRLASVVNQFADTAIALQQIKTNAALSQANHALATVTGPELIAQCLSIAKEEGVPPGGCITGSAAGLAISTK